MLEYFHEINRLIYYFLLRNIRKPFNYFYKDNSHIFLFILSPPYCGSTLLNQILSTSKNVSCNNYLGVREGQLLPRVKKIMFKKDRWENKEEYPWAFIKKEWLKYWDFRKKILLDKSCTNIMRLEAINKFFENSFYIALVRNPYAQAEGIIRRNNASAEYAANFAIKCLQYQKENYLLKKRNVLFISYEDLCDKQEDIVEKIYRFLPDLEDIKIDLKFSAHNFNSKVQNLNQKKIKKLTDNQLLIINNIFKKESELLNFFNYKLINK